MADNHHVIYYSNFCDNSKDLLKELTEKSLLNNFEKICVDDITKLNIKLPHFLTAVPTILVPDYSKPLIGVDAFKWIKWKLKQLNQGETNLNPYEDDYFSNSFSSISSSNTASASNSNFTSLDNNDKIINQSQDELKNYASTVVNNLEQNYEKLIQDRNYIHQQPQQPQQSKLNNTSSYYSPDINSSISHEPPPELPPQLQSLKTRGDKNY